MGALLWFALGAFIGWLVTHIYAKRTEAQLRDIAEVARRQLDAVHEQLLKIGLAFAAIAEDRKMVEWVRDSEGNITFGRVIRLEVKSGAMVFEGQNVECSVSNNPPAPNHSDSQPN